METVQISERESKVLKELVEVYIAEEEGTCRYMKYIAAEVGLDYSQTRRAVRSLARKGLAEFHRGLFNDEGMVAGSGYCATKKGALVFRACVDCKKEVAEMDDQRCWLCWDNRICTKCGKKYSEHKLVNGSKEEFEFPISMAPQKIDK